jgi:hypothetical protein
LIGVHISGLQLALLVKSGKIGGSIAIFVGSPVELAVD